MIITTGSLKGGKYILKCYWRVIVLNNANISQSCENVIAFGDDEPSEGKSEYLHHFIKKKTAGDVVITEV